MSIKPAKLPDLESLESGSVPARNKIPAVHADRGQTCAVRKLQGGLAPVLHMSTRAGVTAAQRFLQAHVQLNRANNFDGRAVAHSTKAFWMRPSEERIDILPHNVAARAHLEEYQRSGAPQDAAGQKGALKKAFIGLGTVTRYYYVERVNEACHNTGECRRQPNVEAVGVAWGLLIGCCLGAEHLRHRVLFRSAPTESRLCLERECRPTGAKGSTLARIHF